MRLDTEILVYSPDVVAFDTAHSDDEDHHRRSLEAFIRRVWTNRPTAKILFMNFFGVDNNAVDDCVPTTDWIAWLAVAIPICNHYGVVIVDYKAAVTDLVINQGHHLNEYFSDVIHPTTVGQALAASLLEAKLTPSFLANRQSPDTLPARMYGNDDYEQTPTILLGTDYTSRTGTWTDNSGLVGRVSSTEVGATITYTVTCVSYGCPTVTPNNAVEISIDGGPWVGTSLYQNGRPTGLPRATRTLAFKVVSGTVRIDKFWAI